MKGALGYTWPYTAYTILQEVNDVPCHIQTYSQLRHYWLTKSQNCRRVFRNGQDKTIKVSPNKKSIIEYLPGLPQDTKSLVKLLWKRVKKSIKSNLGIESLQIYQGHQLLQDNSEKFMGVTGNALCVTWRLS